MSRVSRRNSRVGLLDGDARYGRVGQFTTRSDGGIDLPFGFSRAYPSPLLTGAVARYVDSTGAGSDSNSGQTAGSAKATLAAAVNSAMQFGTPGIVYVNAPVTAPLRETNVLDFAQPLWIVSLTPGVPWYAYGSVKYTSGWTSDGSGVYHQTHLADPKSVWVTDWLDANGFNLRLKQNIGTPTAPAAGEYGYSGGNLYVNLPDGSDPATHTIEAPRYAYAIQTKGPGLLTTTDGWGRYGYIAPFMVGGAASGTGRGHFFRCVGEYGGQSPLGAMFSATVNATELVCVDCRASRSLNDGFDVSGSVGVPTKVLLWNCRGSYNEDQGGSPHQDGSLYVVGSRFDHNGDGGIVAVDRTHTEIYASQFDNNLLGQNDNGLDRPGRAAGVDFFHATCSVIMDDVDIAQNQGAGFTAAAGTPMTLNNVRSGLANGNTSADRWDL